MRITQLLILGLLATALPVQFAVADVDGERAALARIIHELQAIELRKTIFKHTRSRRSVNIFLKLLLFPPCAKEYIG